MVSGRDVVDGREATGNWGRVVGGIGGVVEGRRGRRKERGNGGVRIYELREIFVRGKDKTDGESGGWERQCAGGM